MTERQAVVLAGGRATRLGEHAAHTPKYLVAVAGRPFAVWQLERLVACGIRDVVVCIGHLGGAIRSALGDGGSLDVRLRYSEDSDAPLGTGGALRHALPLLQASFLVTYGDSYLPFDYASPIDDLALHPEASGTMTVYRNAGRFDPSNVDVECDLVRTYDKRASDDALSFIDYGAVALRRTVVEALPSGPSDLADLLGSLARAGSLRALEARERFYEIGSPKGLNELDAMLSSRGRLP